MSKQINKGNKKKSADKSYGVYTIEIADLNNLGCGVGRLPDHAGDAAGRFWL